MMIALKHAGLVCATEENADRFYQTLLGLTKAEPKVLPKTLSKQIFGVDSDLTMINYMKDDLHFEIFIHDRKPQDSGTIEHICLEVSDRVRFLETCESMGVSVIRIEKDGKTLVFITDFDGHLFEIKEKA